MARKAMISSPYPAPIARRASPHRVVSAAAASATVAASGVARYGWATDPTSKTTGASVAMAAASRALVVGDMTGPPLLPRCGAAVLAGGHAWRASPAGGRPSPGPLRPACIAGSETIL